MAEQLIVIRTGMASEEECVKWIGADRMHDAILRLLDRRLAVNIDGQVIDDLGDEIMKLIFELPQAVRDGP